MLCPHCKKDLKEVGIKNGVSGNRFYDMNLDKDGDISYEQDEFDSSGESWYNCGDCGDTIEFNIVLGEDFEKKYAGDGEMIVKAILKGEI
ncbi:MAG: hypothetical protein PHY56_00135 [Candidatus Omnitrophica bacterium]|nr:hypothetical protein [Candidatus Omnitrophota bacterium]